jgi:predicted  nucleic acid-binding Zn-ribbon protein
MPTLSEVFRTIHRLRRHARDLQAEIDRGPIQLKARQTFAAKQAKALQDAREELKKTQVTVREREADLKAAHQTLTRYRAQLNDVTDKKQYDALRHEIADTEARLATLEDTILTGMARADEQAAQVPLAEEAARKAQADLAAYEGEQKDRVARLAEQLRDALAEIKAAEAELPADVKPEYARRIASYGPDGLAPVEQNCCSFCHTGISAQNRVQLMQGMFLTCTACYRALYLPEP